MFTRKMLADFLRVIRFRLQKGRMGRLEFERLKNEAYSLHSMGVDQRLDWAIAQFRKVKVA